MSLEDRLCEHSERSLSVQFIHAKNGTQDKVCTGAKLRVAGKEHWDLCLPLATWELPDLTNSLVSAGFAWLAAIFLVIGSIRGAGGREREGTINPTRRN